ncbi:MAG: ATP-dependent RNA helicase RhlE, partial [Luteibaculaceae bacterium]
MGFKELNLTAQFVRAVEALGFTEPTPIQQKAIPMIMGGQDLIGVAQTGTGKTAAFGLPILQKIKYAQGMEPRALIVTPSRELAVQGKEKLCELATETDIRIGVIYGGKGTLKKQRELVEGGLDVVVGTPGRIMELYFEGKLVFKKLQFLVLDEADKMMDMGFMPQIRNLLEIVPRKRQNLLFSATFSPRVEELSHEFLEFPLKVEISPQATPVDTVEQFIFKVPNKRTKIQLLQYLFEHEENLDKVMIFARTREAAEQINRFVDRRLEGAVRAIHANKGQNSRLNALDDFRNEDIRV